MSIIRSVYDVGDSASTVRAHDGIERSLDPAAPHDEIILVNCNDLAGGDCRLWCFEHHPSTVTRQGFDGRWHSPVLRRI